MQNDDLSGPRTLATQKCQVTRRESYLFDSKLPNGKDFFYVLSHPFTSYSQGENRIIYTPFSKGFRDLKLLVPFGLFHMLSDAYFCFLRIKTAELKRHYPLFLVQEQGR